LDFHAIVKKVGIEFDNLGGFLADLLLALLVSYDTVLLSGFGKFERESFIGLVLIQAESGSANYLDLRLTSRHLSEGAHMH
jgi:hypothetical protein